jgi:O-antigen/teichoic acid export membrane protein
MSTPEVGSTVTEVLETRSRSEIVYRNLVVLLGVRGASFVVNLWVIRVGLELVSTSDYGVWLVLSSLVTWISLFDFGLGNGIRNVVAIALARRDLERAQRYLSTGYVLVFAICGLFLLLALGITPFVHWSRVLSAPDSSEEMLRALALIALVSFSLRLGTGLVSSLLLGGGKSALTGLIDLVANVATLLTLEFLKSTSAGSLFSLGATISVMSAIVPAVATFLVFRWSAFHQIRPSLKSFERKLVRELLGPGIRFFIISTAAVIVFTSSNIVIAHICGPGEVTVYNVAFKYFSLLSVGFAVILTPFWSAFTDAFTTGDTHWAKRAMRRLLLVWMGVSLVAVVMVLVSPVLIRFWLGDAVRVPFGIAVVFAIYTCIINWNGLFAYFLNGVGKIHLQMMYAVFLLIAHVPLCLLFASVLGMGLMGILVASILSLSIGAAFQPLQYRRIITGDASGIWAK